MNVSHPTAAFVDARGMILDVLEDEIIEHVSLITSAAGSVRGNHFHRETHQWLYVLSGALRAVVRAPGGAPVERVIRAGDLLFAAPQEQHALEALEDSTMLALTRGPRGGREYESDTFRLEQPLIPPDAAGSRA